MGHVCPTVNLNFKIAPKGTAGHSDALGNAAICEEGWKATVIAVKAIVLTAYDHLSPPDKVKAIQEQFNEMKAEEGKSLSGAWRRITLGEKKK